MRLIIKLIFAVWFLFMLAVMFIPVFMLKRGIFLNGRDLFFTFIGMLVMAGFSLIAICT